MKPRCYFVLFCLLLFSCTHNTTSIKNEKKGELTATHNLVQSDEKKILLDYETAPKSPYIQMMEGADGEQILTFLNPHKNAIYFYDYDNAIYTGRIEYEKEGPNGILRMTAYYIHNMDSIYVYNTPRTELALTDSTGRVKQRISLRGNRDDWYNYLPQYTFNTVIPIIKVQDKLVLTGFQVFAIPSEKINELCFAACIDMKTNEVEYMYTYPEELYDSNANWEGDIMTYVFPELSPTGEMIHSFPMSHNIYIAPWNTNDFKTKYAGSNNASTINSINLDPKETPQEVSLSKRMQEDWYTAIRYDSYRKVYYRILLQSIPGADHSTGTAKKPITVIIMDEQFNYMGETVIGTGEEWNWINTFVTREGLNIEYISNDEFDEDYMTLKIFTVEKIDR